MSDQLACRTCGHYAVACDDSIEHYKGEIADLEKQLAEKDKEIERMRPVVEAAIWHEHIYKENNTRCSVCKAVREYEQPTKPDGGTET